MRKLARGGGEQPQRECELAASSTPGQKREPPTGQARNSGQAIERRMAGPGLRGRQFRRPRQRLAAKADPNRIDGVFELLHFLHLSLRASESKTQARSGGGYRLTNRCSIVKLFLSLCRHGIGDPTSVAGREPWFPFMQRAPGLHRTPAR